jgi:hypothetical protein
MSTVVFEWEADYVARALRPADRRELEAALPLEIGVLVHESLKRSVRGGAIRRPAKLQPWEPIALFGIVPWEGMPHAARPWLLATPGLDDYRIRLLRLAPKILADLCMGEYKHLENHVSAENLRSIELIEWLGFTLGPAEPLGHKGALFRRFWKDIRV